MGEVLTESELNQLLTAINSIGADGPDFTGAPEPQSRKIKIYDFKRPDKISKAQIRKIAIVHETFAGLAETFLSEKCKTDCKVNLASVDQLAYEEFIRTLPIPTTLAIVNMQPLNGLAVMEIDPACTFEILDRILGGDGYKSKQIHKLTNIEQSIISGVLKKMLVNLQEAWKPILELQPQLVAIEENPQFMQIVSPTEMVVLVTIECTVCDTVGMINICLPCRIIESISDEINVFNKYDTDNIKPVDTPKINIEKLGNLKKTIRAEYFRKEMTIEKLTVLLNEKGIIFNGEQSSFNGKLFIDNVCLGEFNENNNHSENSHKKISIQKIEYKLERNYMNEKNNVIETNGNLKDIKVQIIAELGRTVKDLGEVSAFSEGTILELDKLAGDPVDIFANNVKIATGEVVVVDENFGVRIIEIVKELEANK